MNHAVSVLTKFRNELTNKRNCFLGVIKNDPKAKVIELQKKVKVLEIKISEIDLALEQLGSGK